MASERGKTGAATVWNSLRAAHWSKNEDDEQARQFGGPWPTPTVYSTLMGRKRGGKEQTATPNR